MPERVKPGRLKVSARGLNQALAAGEAHAKQQVLAGSTPTGKVFRPGVITIRNSSSAALQRGDCVQLFGTYLSNQSRHPRTAVIVGEDFADLSVVSHGPLFAITLDPVPVSGYCEAVIAGAVLARVNLTGTGHFVIPQAGSHVLKRDNGWGIGRLVSPTDSFGSEALTWITLEKQIAAPPACYHRRSSSHLTVSGIGICADLQFGGRTHDFGDLAEAGADNGTLKIKAIAQHIAPVYELHWSCTFRYAAADNINAVASLQQWRGWATYEVSEWQWSEQWYAQSGGSPAHSHTIKQGISGGSDNAYLTASGFMVTDLGENDLLRIVLPTGTNNVPGSRLLLRPITGY